MPERLPSLPVIRNLGGCGGTLLSRLFGALPRTVVLSETNPRSANLFGGHLNPLRQLRRWRPQLLENAAEFDDAEIGDPPRFGQMLQEIAQVATRCDYRLIIRDFNYADYIGVPFIWPPAHDSSLDAAIQDRFSPRSVVLIRHPADQLASLRTHRSLETVLTAQRFVAGSHAFLDDHGTSPIFRYEDLTMEPGMLFQEMCEALAIPFSASALENFATVDDVTGSLGRAAERQIVAAPSTPGAARARCELADVPGHDSLLERLGYGA